MTEIETRIKETTLVFGEIESLLGRQLTDIESARLDTLLNQLQVFLDDCARDRTLSANAENIRQKIKARFAGSSHVMTSHGGVD